MELTDLHWFKLTLRVQALEHGAGGLKYSFSFDPSTTWNQNTILRCYLYYDPEKISGMAAASEEDRREVFLNWRSAALRMVAEALKETPHLATVLVPERQLLFVVLEGYGMGSKKVFEQ